ncbi:MAG: dihydroorotate dehydrogenase (quinone) [Halofilum sp. (in: g-proteobacteria)]|nr:dihydroorotate dehydrogenase (quinone) [Halofilum sp. (in: g-proteobacteria)]
MALRALDVLAPAARRLAPAIPDDPRELFGLRLPNPVGLAAGLDKNADHVDALGALGFGFLEVGTVTPRPQPGNPRPRLFRVPGHEALINRMGFNNKGVEHAAARLERRRYRGVVGVNIGKNRDTPLAQAGDDYGRCLERIHALADYVAVNVSSPNTPGLRELQAGPALERLLGGLAERRARLESGTSRRVPLLVKIAPDIDDDGLAAIAHAVLASGLDGVIATNTTADHASVAGCRHAAEEGGLSGAPLAPLATDVLRRTVAALDDRVPVVGVGGVVWARRRRRSATPARPWCSSTPGSSTAGRGWWRRWRRR